MHKDNQRYRLIQLVWLTELFLAFTAGKVYLEGYAGDSLVILSAAILMIGILAMVHFHKLTLATGTFGVLLTSMVLTIMWTSAGIRDNATLGLPGILIFVALTGGLRFIAPIVAIMIVNMFLMVWYGNNNHDFPPVQALHNYSSAFDLSLILTLSGYAVYSLAIDNLNLLSGLASEVQKVEKSRHELDYLANHDALTGLPNRAAAEKHFLDVKKQLDNRDSRQFALFFVDLDEFKEVNDTLGHDMGDQFLIQISKHLLKILRHSDRIFRIGGDEFLVYVEDYGSVENLI